MGIKCKKKNYWKAVLVFVLLLRQLLQAELIGQ